MPSFADANSVLSGFVPKDSEEEPKKYRLAKIVAVNRYEFKQAIRGE